MRVLLQRVSSAHVSCDGKIVGAINRGLLALVGIFRGDTQAHAEYLADRTLGLRIFPESQRDDGPLRDMHLSVQDVAGAVLAISQFTLAADTSRGRRPGFSAAEDPALAEPLYRHYVESLKLAGITVATGVFGADMQVTLVNDGPVTILLER